MLVFYLEYRKIVNVKKLSEQKFFFNTPITKTAYKKTKIL